MDLSSDYTQHKLRKRKRDQLASLIGWLYLDTLTKIRWISEA